MPDSPKEEEDLLQLGPDSAGRTILICLFFISVGAAALLEAQPEIAGLVLFLWFYWAWFSWVFGVRTYVNVDEGHIEIRNPLRLFRSSWSDVKEVNIGPKIVFIGTGGKRFVSALYSANPLSLFLARHTSLLQGRAKLEGALQSQLKTDRSVVGPSQDGWSLNWKLPSRRFVVLTAIASAAVEVIGLLR